MSFFDGVDDRLSGDEEPIFPKLDLNKSTSFFRIPPADSARVGEVIAAEASTSSRSAHAKSTASRKGTGSRTGPNNSESISSKPRADYSKSPQLPLF